jgi:hypothetical protein
MSLTRSFAVATSATWGWKASTITHALMARTHLDHMDRGSK